MRGARSVAIALTLVAASYVVQIVRPLHLEPDSVCYLLAAEGAAHDSRFNYAAFPQQRCFVAYPPGYPALLAVVMETGVAGPRSFFLLNVLFLGLGLAATYLITRRAFGLDRAAALGLVCVAMLSYPLFRAVNLPLSDCPFFGVAMACILALVWAQQRQGLEGHAALAVATILAGAAIMIRTIGIALIPAVLWTCVVGPRTFDWIRRLSNTKRTIIVAASVGALTLGIGTFLIATRSTYVRLYLPAQYAHGLVSTLTTTWEFRLRELGQIAANLPASKLPAALGPVFPWIGAVAIGVLCYAGWCRRHSVGPVDVFLLCYVLILGSWPAYDPRFWLPVIPLFAAWLAASLQHAMTKPVPRFLVSAYLIAFLLAGVAGQVYNTRLSLSGAHFPEYFRDDYLGPAYRVAWGTVPPEDSMRADTTVLRLLRQYEPRARKGPGTAVGEPR